MKERFSKNRGWLAVRQSGFIVHVFGIRIGIGYETTENANILELHWMNHGISGRSRGFYAYIHRILITGSISW